MKQKNVFFGLMFIIIMANTLSICAQQVTKFQPDYDAIAQKMVNYSLEVKPGEVVIINGTPAELDIIKALVVAVSKAGGQPTVQIGIPEANRQALMETPVEYLKIIPTYPLMQVRAADCFINTGSIQDLLLFKDVPEERLAASRQAYMALFGALSRAHFRSVDLGQAGGIPTKAYAEFKGADYEEMLNMFWKSVDADYNQIFARGQAIAKTLRPNSVIKVTSKAGTDLTFKISEITPRTNCGRCAENIAASGPAQVWLPAGEVYVCINPSSAFGTLVIPSSEFMGNKVTNLRLTFQNGRITSLKADENGELIQERLDMCTGDKDVLSIIDIGLNTECHPLKGSDYYSWEMAGMVTANIGNNAWAGGNVESDNGMNFFLPDATLSVDGNIIVENGQLKAVEATKRK